ncbi:hypothetical protein DPMN_105845 [Dreissena polymorpha]|uniref:Uncharacterized protein n=1 Tax=Dreissena polymorpha TaxID=45954 RepID=A0A9D4K3Z5_DREPO|nr:hypothetical protein DPMN_105845 [Dreissena polymorpha]
MPMPELAIHLPQLNIRVSAECRCQKAGSTFAPARYSGLVPNVYVRDGSTFAPARAEEKKGLEDGMYTIIFFSPEILDNIDRGDEFRPAYNGIVELRGLFTNVPVLLLSATCTKTVRLT